MYGQRLRESPVQSFLGNDQRTATSGGHKDTSSQKNEDTFSTSCTCHVCVFVCVFSKEFPRLLFFVVQADHSLWAGSKQLPLSDAIEEVIDHFPRGGNVERTAGLTLIVSQPQSHLFIRGCMTAHVSRRGRRE